MLLIPYVEMRFRFIYEAEGCIATNYRVIQDDRRVLVAAHERLPDFLRSRYTHSVKAVEYTIRS